VTAGGMTYPLDLPFFVLATQNPIEQEGTYPLPEAQLDRFMLNIEIRYPDFDDEVQIVMRTTSVAKPKPHKIMEGTAILRYQDLVRRVPVSPFVISYAAVSIEDIQALAPSVLRHRIFPNFKAQGEGLSSVDIISRLLSEVKPSEDGKAAR